MPYPQPEELDGSIHLVTGGLSKKSARIASTKERTNNTQMENYHDIFYNRIHSGNNIPVKQRPVLEGDRADYHTMEEMEVNIPGASEIMKMSKVELILLLKKMVAVPYHKVPASLNRLGKELDKLDPAKYQVMSLGIHGDKYGGEASV